MSAATQQTLVDLANQISPDGDLLTIAEILARDNPILQDGPWMEANNTFAHKIVRRLSLPSGTWRELNAGVAVETSKSVVVNEAIGMLETYAESDKDLVDAAPSPKQFRMNNAMGFLEGLSQTLATAIFYADASLDPQKPTGLSPRMASLAATTNVIGEGGASANVQTSAYIVQWGVGKVYMMYPRGDSAGLGIKHTDKGQVTLSSATTAVASSAQYEGYRDHFQVKVGIAVENPRCIARLANIDITGNSIDEDNLITLLNRMPNEGAGASIYVNTSVKTQMEIALKDKANVNFTTDNGLGGVPVLKFRGNPVRRCEAIVQTEAVLT